MLHQGGICRASNDMHWNDLAGRTSGELDIECPQSITFYEDNQACIHLQRWQHSRRKHVDVKYNFIRNLLTSRQIEVKYIRTNDQLVNILPEDLPKQPSKIWRHGWDFKSNKFV